MVILEDIHWAEPTLLDLLEYILDLATDAPLLVVCPARPELLEVRPGWGASKRSATTLHLEPLAADVAGQLLDALPGGSALPLPLREQIVRGAEGNPLFVEEMLAMLIDDGQLTEGDDGTWKATGDLERVTVPPSIAALLAARIDALPKSERALAERASVIGRVFEAAALRELAPDAQHADVGRTLLALVRKELVRPERAELTAGDAFKFRHLLIRDAAYDGLPKAERAELHERFADWLERTAGDRVAEYEAILAYHLDQAYGFRAELGQHGETVDRLAERAGQHYLVAARQADDRNDAVSERPLLERAVALVKPGTGRWLDALIDLGVTLGNLGELTLADDRFEQALASIDIEPIQRAKARIQRAGLGALTRKGSWALSLERAVRDELPTLERAGDQEALAGAYQMLSYVLGETDRRQQAFEAITKALGHARASGVRGTQVVMAGDFAAVAVRALPPREARKAIAESIAVDDVDGGARAGLLNGLGWLAALDGDLEDGRSKMEEAIRIADAFSMVTLMTNFRVEAGRIAMWAGDPASARTSFRAAMEIALAHGLATDVLEAKAWLASALLALADDDGAASLAAEVIDQRGLEWAVDVPSMRVQGRLLARRGNVAAGRAVMQEAWEVASRAGSYIGRIEVAVDEIQLLLEAGLREDAELAAARARQLLTGYPSVQLLRMIDEAANAGR